MNKHRWPQWQLAAVPSDRVAEQLALEVREFSLVGSASWSGPCDFQQVCERAGFRISYVPLEAGTGGHEALLVPRLDGSFDILVDDDPPPPDSLLAECEGDTDEQRAQYRIAHEIGHSFFYDRSSAPPRRLIPPSPQEERFCDLFASALLVPPGVTARISAVQEVLECRKRFEVSTAVASKALTREHPGTVVIKATTRRQDKPETIRLFVAWSIPNRFAPGTVLHSRAAAEAFCAGAARDEETVRIEGVLGRYLVDAVRMPDVSEILMVMMPTLRLARRRRLQMAFNI
ncbi:MAG: ImmA/IrrE family metallo-endopeptidase [Dehalococcoidia bacterium]